MDWEVCVICQKGGHGLKCPADSNQKNGLEIYTDFLKAVEQFRELDVMPVNLDLKGIDSPEVFLENRACWHKACKLKFAASRVQKERDRKRKHDTNDQPDEGSRKSKRQESGTPDQNTCIFCGLGKRSVRDQLFDCSTKPLSDTLKMMATAKVDARLLARMEGDLIAIEAKYHNRCLTEYKNKYKSLEKMKDGSTVESSSEKIIESQVFAELVAYIETYVEEGNLILKLSELHGLYEGRLKSLGVTKTINKTRVKEKLLIQFCEHCQEQTDGKNMLFVFDEGMKKVLKEAIQARDTQMEALTMASVVKTVRKDAFDWEPFQFTGSFPPECQTQSIPPSLKSLISMLLNGPNLRDQDPTCMTKPAM